MGELATRLRIDLREQQPKRFDKRQPKGGRGSDGIDQLERLCCVRSAILAGKPIVKGTRLSVGFVLDLLAAGWAPQALRENYPNLTEERVRAVLAYAAETFREERFYLLPPTGTNA
jgi:uncharacterized protein (DUF433 family)